VTRPEHPHAAPRLQTRLSLVATCSPGLEPLLAAELSELGAQDVTPGRSAVRFRGTWREIWRSNYWLRTANRVLIELTSCAARDGEALYRAARRLTTEPMLAGLPTAELLSPHRSLAVFATSSRSQLRDTRWIALKVKDGLVDGQRAFAGRRSSVETKRPDLPFRVWLRDDRASLLLDSSREPLDRRGYRVRSGDAPVREQLAAACVMSSGWSGAGSIVDPMCGTGTLLIEAAWWALGRAPGALRRSWVFESWPGFAPGLFREERSRGPASRATADELRIYGADRSPEAVAASLRNLEAAGLASIADVRLGDAFELEPPDRPGLVAINPAYGERLEADTENWRLIGDLLKQRYAGWRAVVLAGGVSRGKHIGLRPSKRIPVRNGPLDARILVFDLYRGRRSGDNAGRPDSRGPSTSSD
jgi:putative N6-adenine-specific DNA methylase